MKEIEILAMSVIWISETTLIQKAEILGVEDRHFLKTKTSEVVPILLPLLVVDLLSLLHEVFLLPLVFHPLQAAVLQQVLLGKIKKRLI